MVKEIQLDELEPHLAQGAVLIDVRELEEVEEGAIDGMIHMPLSEFESFKDKLPKDKPIVFYCRSGRRSMAAGEMASQWTSQPLFSLEGGYLAYIQR